MPGGPWPLVHDGFTLVSKGYTVTSQFPVTRVFTHSNVEFTNLDAEEEEWSAEIPLDDLNDEQRGIFRDFYLDQKGTYHFWEFTEPHMSVDDTPMTRTVRFDTVLDIESRSFNWHNAVVRIVQPKTGTGA